MTIEDLKAALPAYAKDLKLNLSSILREEGLTEQQLWGALVATAIASRSGQVITTIEQEAAQHLSPEALEAAKAAAAVMSMNNVYYRFVHLAGSPDYKTMPAKLRMNVIANPGVERADFELWSLAVSAVNGCGLCIESHEQELRKASIANTAIQAAVRVGAIVHAVSVILEAEGEGEAAERAAA